MERHRLFQRLELDSGELIANAFRNHRMVLWVLLCETNIHVHSYTLNNDFIVAGWLPELVWFLIALVTFPGLVSRLFGE